MIPGLLAQDIAESLREFITVFMPTETAMVWRIHPA